jgi:hypothetical protein
MVIASAVAVASARAAWRSASGGGGREHSQKLASGVSIKQQQVGTDYGSGAGVYNQATGATGVYSASGYGTYSDGYMGADAGNAGYYHPLTTTTRYKFAYTDTSTLQQPAIAGSPSMYCFVLIVPNSDEAELLKMQIEQHLSIFTCPEFGVFSNISVFLTTNRATGKPVFTTPIGGNLQVTKGGRWGTALNTDVFIRLWQTVSQNGRWRYHDWIVKVDADAVFLPDRLQRILRPVQQARTKPIFFNNCKWGMHGPLEVLSQAGLYAYLTNVQQCEDIRHRAMEWQDVHWNATMNRWIGSDDKRSFGEDQYLRLCLHRLHVNQINNFRLLDEIACGGKPAETQCAGNFVAYHPFKDKQSYAGCLVSTQRQGMLPNYG